MGEIKYLNPKSLSKPNGPYHHASKVDGWLFLAGQIPVNPDAPDAPLPEGIEAQAEIVFKNIALILEAEGYGFSDIVQVRNYLKDLKNDMAGFNRVYSKYIPSEKLPPRTTIGVSRLAKDSLVEIDIVAYKK
jgi:2-iminobutanoate/2-iminopropanoate deaminase